MSREKPLLIWLQLEDLFIASPISCFSLKPDVFVCSRVSIAHNSTARFVPLYFASYSVFVVHYTKPVVKSEVRDEIKGADVEKDFTSFYTSPKKASTANILTTDRKLDGKYISVFGVRIPNNPTLLNFERGLTGETPKLLF